jgi:cytochrome P450
MAPDLIRAVLLDETDSFEKGEIARRALGPALGDAIITADGSRWRWQRRAVAAIFRQERIRDFLPAMVAGAERTRDRWRALPPGAEIDVAREMMRTTFDIILNAMLPGHSLVDLELIERSITEYLESTSWGTTLAMIGAPGWVPYPGMYRARRARHHVHRILESLIGEAKQSPVNRNDLLSLLTNATDPETGKSMNPIDVRNNLLTFIMAGHETTALALTWAFYLLSLHPDVELRVKREISAVTEDGPVRVKHIDALAYTDQVIQEAMRLYPPVALIVRAARRDVELGNEQIRAGTTVYVPIYAVHRHEELWCEPGRFDPSRFESEAAKARDRYSYLPFGAGPRVCIGQIFAQREATAVLATLLSSFQLRLRPGHDPEPRLRVTLRPAGGMPMRLAFESRPSAQ